MFLSSATKPSTKFCNLPHLITMFSNCPNRDSNASTRRSSDGGDLGGYGVGRSPGSLAPIGRTGHAFDDADLIIVGLMLLQQQQMQQQQQQQHQQQQQQKQQ